jgi:hypothetical protein
MLIELERKAPEGMGSRVEQFEQIRRDRDREGLSIRALAVRHGVHRRTVKQALLSPVPPVKRAPVTRAGAEVGAVSRGDRRVVVGRSGRAGEAASYRMVVMYTRSGR